MLIMLFLSFLSKRSAPIGEAVHEGGQVVVERGQVSKAFVVYAFKDDDPDFTLKATLCVAVCVKKIFCYSDTEHQQKAMNI